MAINKREDGKWTLDFTAGGRGGKRVVRVFATKTKAVEYETWAKEQARTKPAWEPEKKDKRKLLDLVEAWYLSHGKFLRSAEDTNERLKAMCISMGNPLATNFKSKDFTLYRKLRVDSGISENTLNREHAYLRGVFNELIRTGEWKGENPLKSIRQIKIQEKEMRFLDLIEVIGLLEALKMSTGNDAYLVTKIALAIGARWSEAESLKKSQVRDNQISLRGKNGKVRVMPISGELASQLKKHIEGCKEEKLFKGCYGAFRVALEKAGIDLPDGQLTHVLRHTFASHFMMNGGNIITLQKALDHSTLTMTMRYAHLAPDHLESVIKLNPLSNISSY